MSARTLQSICLVIAHLLTPRAARVLAADATKSPANPVALEGRAAAADGRWKIPYIQSPNPSRRPSVSTVRKQNTASSIPGPSALDRLQSKSPSHVQVTTFSEVFSSTTKKTFLLPLPNDGLQARRNRTLIQNVWDDHPREAVTSHAYPWRCIGWVNGGTGTLVGPNLVLTAAHVVIDERTGQLYPNIGYFYLNRVDSNCYRQSWIHYIWWGTNPPNADRAHDCAILKLADRPGDEVGWMGVANTDYFYPSNFPAPLSVSGYSYDYNYGNTATVDRNVTIRSIDSGLLHHDGSTARGSSGCPIFGYFVDDNGKGTAIVYGLNVAEQRNGGQDSFRLTTYDDSYTNYAVETYTFLNKVKQLKGEN